MGSFALLGLILAAVGVFSVAAQTVAQRTRELAVRRVVGADSGDLLRLVLRESLTTAAIGIVAGMGAALETAHLTRAFAFGIAPLDLRLYAVGTLILVVTATFASLPAAVVATRADPATILRGE